MSLRLLFHNWRDDRHPESGGAERYLIVVAEGLAQLGHDVTVLTASYPGAYPDEVINQVRYVRRGGRYSIYPRALVSQILRAHSADVVIDVQNGVPYLSPLVRRGPVVNLVHHVHREQWPVVFGPQVSRAGWWLESRMAPAVYKRTEYVAVSEATKAELVTLGVDAGRITVIHNGTDDPPDVCIPRAAFPIVTVLGRLVPQKRIEMAMTAVAELARHIPDLQLRIVGSGYWEPTLRTLATELGIEERTVFTGYVSEQEKHQILAESWVHALPSLKEGWGLVIAEAGLHGTPTVAFADAGGTTESIRDGVTGVLVKGGQPEFTTALRRLLSDGEHRASLSNNAATWVRQFRWQESISLWDELLRRAHEGH